MTQGETWTVHPHEPIEKLEDNLWRVEGSLPNMPLRRVMTLARDDRGDVFVHNAIALEEPLMRELEEFGRLRYLVVPNAFHRLDAPAFKRRYPRLEVVCPVAARKRVAQVVSVDHTYDSLAATPGVELRHVAGTGGREGVMIVRHGDSASVVLNDLLFNMPHVPGIHGFVLRYLTASSGGPRVSRIAKLFLIKHKGEVAREFELLAQIPGLVRIIVSHHETISDEPAAALRHASIL